MKHELNSQNTKQMLCDALIELSAKKAFSKITVSEIVNLCNVNRKTFYYHFEDVYDLLEWHLNNEIKKAISTFDPVYDLNASISFAVDYMNQHPCLKKFVQDPLAREKITKLLNEVLSPKVLELFQQSKEEAELKNDNLGVLNSLHALVDLFLHWEAPEYANLYASEALRVENAMTTKNPMVSTQTYINKGWVMLQLGEIDSVSVYTERARQLCQSLPYNSGMVDVNLLHGTHLTELGGENLSTGIQELQEVVRQGTSLTRAKAYHQLAQTYLKNGDLRLAEPMLDSLFVLLTPGDAVTYIPIDYQPILNHYIKNKNYKKVEQYTQLMLQERHAFKEKKLNLNMIRSIVNLQVEQEQQELKLVQLQQTNQLLLFLCCLAVTIIIIAVIAVLFIKQRKQHVIQMKQADEKLSSLVEQLKQSNAEKEIRAQEIKDLLDDKDKRQELETLTPTVLQTDGESKFRQCFEILHPLFLPRLREKVPSITRREELLSMLIVLKQDNKQISELLAIAPRSVLMLRHRFRQKIGMTTELSLEDFITDTLKYESASTQN